MSPEHCALVTHLLSAHVAPPCLRPHSGRGSLPGLRACEPVSEGRAGQHPAMRAPGPLPPVPPAVPGSQRAPLRVACHAGAETLSPAGRVPPSGSPGHMPTPPCSPEDDFFSGDNGVDLLIEDQLLRHDDPLTGATRRPAATVTADIGPETTAPPSAQPQASTPAPHEPGRPDPTPVEGLAAPPPPWVFPEPPEAGRTPAPRAPAATVTPTSPPAAAGATFPETAHPAPGPPTARPDAQGQGTSPTPGPDEDDIRNVIGESLLPSRCPRAKGRAWDGLRAEGERGKGQQSSACGQRSAGRALLKPTRSGGAQPPPESPPVRGRPEAGGAHGPGRARRACAPVSVRQECRGVSCQGPWGPTDALERDTDLHLRGGGKLARPEGGGVALGRAGQARAEAGGARPRGAPGCGPGAPLMEGLAWRGTQRPPWVGTQAPPGARAGASSRGPSAS